MNLKSLANLAKTTLRSAEVYKTEVDELKRVYESTKLDTLSWQDVSCRPIARIWILAFIRKKILVLAP